MFQIHLNLRITTATPGRACPWQRRFPPHVCRPVSTERSLQSDIPRKADRFCPGMGSWQDRKGASNMPDAPSSVWKSNDLQTLLPRRTTEGLNLSAKSPREAARDEVARGAETWAAGGQEWGGSFLRPIKAPTTATAAMGTLPRRLALCATHTFYLLKYMFKCV